METEYIPIMREPRSKLLKRDTQTPTRSDYATGRKRINMESAPRAPVLHENLDIHAFTNFFFFLVFLGLHLQQIYGHSQARGRIGAAAAGLCHSHSNARSSHVCDLNHSSRQCQILNPLSRARDRTCILVDTSWISYH